jgi:hypothetical protein
MFHGFLRQSTNSQARTVGPFLDDTDFISPATGLTIANTDVKLNKNAAASVDKNSGGGTHRNNGMYSLTFDSSDTDTVGELGGSILKSGAMLVVFKFHVLEEAVYDALFAASAAGPALASQVPAALDGGFIKAAVHKFNDAAFPSFAVVSDGGNTASAFKTDRTESANNYWKTPAIVVITSGTLAGQSGRISAYNGTTKVLTLTAALTGTPSPGDTGIIINR